MTTAGELWGRVQAAEADEQAARERYEASDVLDPSSEGSPEYEEAARDVDRTWVCAEMARHELDAFLNPQRYLEKGYEAEALDGFRSQAEVDEPEMEAGA